LSREEKDILFEGGKENSLGKFFSTFLSLKGSISAFEG
jgi:hypothetical protein